MRKKTETTEADLVAALVRAVLREEFAVARALAAQLEQRHPDVMPDNILVMQRLAT